MNAITPAKPVIKTSELTWLPLEYLLFHLSPIDKADLFGQVATENVLEIAGQIMHATNSGNGLGWVISRNGRPAAAFGVFQEHKGCWRIWSLGVDHFDVALTLLKPLLETAIPHIREHGGRRIECKTLADRSEMHDLLQLLGFQTEGVLRSYGTKGKTIFSMRICSIQPRPLHCRQSPNHNERKDNA